MIMLIIVVLAGLIIIAIIGALIYSIVKTSSEPGRENYIPPPINEESALEILNRRYANGEITKSEYEQMKRDIKS